jgi:hypothetical protein
MLASAGLVVLGSGAASGSQKRSGPLASSAARHGVLIARSPLRPAGGTVKSANWSGYVVRGHSIKGVATTFTVPTASSPNGFAAEWDGIGGYGTQDLIQAGVAEARPHGSTHYFAWYEMLPAASKQITNCAGNSSCHVSPGDEIEVTINNTASDKWSFQISDPDESWTWSKNVTYKKSRRLSAEWILEAPTVGGSQTALPGLTVVGFGPASTFTVSGSTKTISQGHPVRVLLIKRNNKIEATPSKIAADGQSFNDCAHAKSCAKP